MQVELRDSSGALVGSAQSFASGAAINLGTIPSNVARVNVFSVGGLAAVGAIAFEAASQSSSLDVFLGTGSIPSLTSIELTDVATNWAGLDVSPATQSKLRVAAGISGNITGPVRAATITRLQVGGGINAEIDASGELGAAADIGVIVAGSIGVDGDIGAGSPGNPGFISSVTTTSGDMLGDVIATSEIGDVLASNGTVGNATTRVAITAVDGIDSVVAEAINANVVANANGGGGDLRQIVMSNRNLGFLSGTIRAENFGDSSAADPEAMALNVRGGTLGLDIQVRAIFGDFEFNPVASSGVVTIEVEADWISNRVQLAKIDAITIGGDLRGRNEALRLELEAFGLFTVDGLLDGTVEVVTGGVMDVGDFEGLLAGRTGTLLDCPSDEVDDLVMFLNAPPMIDLIVVRGHACVGRSGGIIVGPTTRVQIGGDFGNVQLGAPAELRLPWGGFIENESQVRIGGDMRGQAFIGCPRLTCSDSELNCFSTLFSNIFANALGANELGMQGWPNDVVWFDGGNESFDFVLTPAFVFPREASHVLSGAIGFVPFRLNDTRSNPVNYQRFPIQSEPMLSSAFNGNFAPSAVRLDFQGPIALTGSGNQPKLEVILLDSNEQPVLDVSRFVTVELGLNSRILQLRAKDGDSVPLPSGKYRVKPLLGTGRVICTDLLPGAAVREVAPFEYKFILSPDCDGDGSVDPANCGDTTICDSIDFNNNSVFPEDQDAIDFFEVLAGGACSTGDCNDIDFNNNTVFPEDDDVIQFFHVLSGGEC